MQPAPSRVLPENPLALLIHQLHALLDRDVDGVVEPGEAVGADEFVFLHHAVDLLGDDAAGLVLAVGLVGRGADQETLVLDLLGGCRTFGLGRFTTATEKTFQKRHGSNLLVRPANRSPFAIHDVFVPECANVPPRSSPLMKTATRSSICWSISSTCRRTDLAA